MSDQVQLTDLDVITRYSIAVRSATADRDELLATLRADLAWLERGRPRATTSYSAPPRYDEGDEPADDDGDSAPRRPPIRRMSVPSTRAGAKKATAKNASAKKAAPRRTAR